MSLEQPPEVHAPHGHRGGVRWLEMMVSISALVVSVVSISVALQHGNVMEKLVAANSLPYVDVMNANVVLRPSGEYQQEMRLELRNVGVGPADVSSVRVSVDGRYLSNSVEILSLCCETAEDARAVREGVGGELVMNQSRTHFIPAGQTAPLFSIRRTEENAAAWDRVELVRRRLIVETCYCSVFGECWQTTTARDRREPVDACAISEESFVP
jgi:hypothetical protein